MLLQNAVKFNLREFQEVWQQSVPEGMSTRLEQLKVGLDLSHTFLYSVFAATLEVLDTRLLHECF